MNSNSVKVEITEIIFLVYFMAGNCRFDIKKQ